MEKVRLSVVSYLNSTPFIYGLDHSPVKDEIELSLDIPSVCASKTLEGRVDAGLIPVAVIPLMKEHYIISDYCIGASGNVGSVILYSEVPLAEIRQVMLDYQSRSSVMLARVLARFFWKIEPEWLNAGENYEKKIGGNTAAVIIGDRTFGLEGKYRYAFDLAGEWEKYTGLPFVFAAWVANKPLPGMFIEKFNAAMRLGVESRGLLSEELAATGKFNTDVRKYLLESISYTLDDPKRKAMEMFLEYIAQLH